MVLQTEGLRVIAFSWKRIIKDGGALLTPLILTTILVWEIQKLANELNVEGGDVILTHGGPSIAKDIILCQAIFGSHEIYLIISLILTMKK